MSQNSEDKEFDQFLKRHRPHAPAAPVGEFDSVMEKVAPRFNWLNFSFKTGLAVAAIALVLVFNPAAPSSTDAELDAFLAEAGSEMFDSEIAEDDSLDYYASL